MSIAEIVRKRGPLTVAAFMDLALYHPEFGYYARAAQRSGRAGDFFTSVDVGPMFGALLARQVAEAARRLFSAGAASAHEPFDLVEVAAGNGRLSADILRALEHDDPEILTRVRLHLVERSGAARAAQPAVLGRYAAAMATSAGNLPERFEGVLIANELLDALPVHHVVMRHGRLRETYVALDGVDGSDQLRLIEDEPSTPALAEYFGRLGIALEEGWRAEVNLAAVDWMRDAVRRLSRGVMLVFDYGHRARELYSVTHSTGTLTTYTGHRASDSATPAWLMNPGEQDITAHVDFTSIAAAAEQEGAQVLGLLDQSYFLMGILQAAHTLENPENPENLDLKSRLALKTLLIPGGLGSTMKVLVVGKNVGTPALAGLSYRVRIT